MTRIVDLRGQVEIDEDPPRGSDVEVVHVPVLDHFDEETWDEIRALSEAGRRTCRGDRARLPAFPGAVPAELRAARSRRSPRRRGRSSSTATAARTAPGSSRPILLRLAGVPAEVIAEDYALERTPARAAASPMDRRRPGRSRARADRTDHGHARRCDEGRPRLPRPQVRGRRSVPARRRPRARCARGGPVAPPVRDEADRKGGRAASGPGARRGRDAEGLRVLAIFGPTASGKSAVAEAVARQIPADAGLPPTRRSSTAACRS